MVDTKSSGYSNFMSVVSVQVLGAVFSTRPSPIFKYLA